MMCALSCTVGVCCRACRLAHLFRALVQPVHKKGNRSNPSNELPTALQFYFRPV